MIFWPLLWELWLFKSREINCPVLEKNGLRLFLRHCVAPRFWAWILMIQGKWSSWELFINESTSIWKKFHKNWISGRLQKCLRNIVTTKVWLSRECLTCLHCIFILHIIWLLIGPLRLNCMAFVLVHIGPKMRGIAWYGSIALIWKSGIGKLLLEVSKTCYSVCW